MTLRRALVLSVLLSAPLAAHDDDPKGTQAVRPALGPGWRPGAVGLGALGGGSTQAPPYDASGVQLLSWVTVGDLGLTLGSNDCWGYVSPSGREYAILGTEEATAFVEVTDPQAPVVTGVVTGPVGVWRDVKTYGEYAYSVHEQNAIGVQVIDLTQIDSGVLPVVKVFEGTNSSSTHNLAIDEQSGYLYRCGGSYHGLRIYDLANPADPQYVGSWDQRYVHDAQVVVWSDGRQLAFCCSGLNYGWDDTGLTILDVTDKQNITVVRQLSLAGGQYSHQGWLSEDRQYFYLGDELDENGVIYTTTHVFAVGDPDNASYVGKFTNQSHSIGHNMYTLDGRLYQANYRSGLRVFDVEANPTSPAEVAWFDPQPTNDTADFGGAWSCYPYLPGGVVLLSDRDLGLFVLRVDEELGRRRCDPAALNSTGQSGRLEAFGSAFVAEDHLTLTARQLPPAESAVLLVSDRVGGSIPPGGGAGTLCIGAPFGTDHASAGTVDGAGNVAFAPDLAALPAWGGPVAVQPGETWHFQVAYRDGGATLATDALAIRFR